MEQFITPNKTKSFNSWTQTEVEKTFGLHLMLTSDDLDAKLNVDADISDFEKTLLERLRKKAFIYVRGWNETELTAKFISGVFDTIDFDQVKYSLFLERPFQGKVNDVKINGKVDMVIAAGRDEPETPYFFLQEFKKEKGAANDPVAQLLLAMLVAQKRNQKKELFGGYISGRNWFFVLLQGNTYTISDGYLATNQAHLLQIAQILKCLKQEIESHFN